MNPYVAAAGIGLSAYGAHKQNETAQKQYELAVRAWEVERDRLRREEMDRNQQQLLTNIMAGGQYAQGAIGNAQSTYGDYARRVGF